MADELIQPSNEPGATRLAIAYEIVRRTGNASGDPIAVAELVGRTIHAMLKAEGGR